MTNKNDWLIRKNLRSVDSLRLWAENPRLNPENLYNTTREFAEEVTNSDSDRSSFIGLAKSIVEHGFIPADPIVVWQNEENQRYYVAEGNRRILALKLLRYPAKAHKSIRGVFNKLASTIDTDLFNKIYVSIAPTFEDAEWYISQRHSTISQQKRWSTEQQSRWIAELFEKYDGDINSIRSRIQITEAELQGIIRTLKLKAEIIKIEDLLTKDEYKTVMSHTFPLTTFNRFFNYVKVRDSWHIKFEGYDFEILGDKSSFYNSFSAVIKRMLLPEGHNDRIDSRKMGRSDDLNDILDSLPKVMEKGESDPSTEDDTGKESNSSEKGEPEDDKPPKKSQKEIERERRARLKNNPDRIRIISDFYQIEVDSHKLSSLFNELKQIPLNYKNSVAASIRIFLDLAVLNYIESEGLVSEICKEKKKDLREIILKARLEFLKKHIHDSKSQTVIFRLLNPENQYSLDVLNGYIHTNDTHYLNKQFLNSFWDSLFPLFTKLVVIKEK